MINARKILRNVRTMTQQERIGLHSGRKSWLLGIAVDDDFGNIPRGVMSACIRMYIEQQCNNGYKPFPLWLHDLYNSAGQGTQHIIGFNRNRKFKCWIIRCGTEEPAPGSSDIIEVNTYIRRLCKDVDFRCMADPMLHMDAAGFYCNKYEKKFYGIGVDRHATEKLTTRIEQYEEKQAKKKRKRLAKHNKQP